MKQLSRLTVDMNVEEHTLIKIASAELGMTMRELLLVSAFQKIREIEDPDISQGAEKALLQFESKALC